MSAEGIDPLNEVNKKLVINTSLLWTGISTTNKKLTEQVKVLTELTKSIKAFTKSIAVSNIVLIRQIDNLTDTIKKYGNNMINSQRDFARTLAHTMSEMVYPISNGMDRLGNQLTDLGRIVNRASLRGGGGGAGGPGVGLTGEESENPMFKIAMARVTKLGKTIDVARLVGQVIEGMEKRMRGVGHTNIGFKPWDQLGEEDRQKSKAPRRGQSTTQTTFEETGGYMRWIKDFTRESRQRQAKLLKTTELIGKTSEYFKFAFQLVDKFVDIGGEGEGKKKKPLFKKYEGENKFLQNIQKFVDKTGEVAPAVMKGATEFMGNFAKRQVVKAFQSGIGFLKQVVGLGTSPAMEALTQTLGSLAKIINVILIPLKPIIFMLDLFATVLEAALSPMQKTLYEALIPIMQELVESLPELLTMVAELVEGEDFQELLIGITEAFTELILSLTEGDLMKTIFNLTLQILDLAMTLVSSNLILSLFRLTSVIIGLAFTLVKPGPDGKTLIEQIIELAVVLGGFALTIFTAFRPLLDWIIGIDPSVLGAVVYGVGLIWAFMQGMMSASYPYGLILGAIYAGLWAAIASPLLSLQEGGSVPGSGPVPIMAHGGEQVWSESKQDDMIELLEENVRLQRQILKMKEDKYDRL